MWSRPTEQRSISFVDLAPGEYMFELQAINQSGLWSPEPARVRFVVRPELWETIWFRAGLAVLAVVFLSIFSLHPERVPENQGE